MARVQNKKLTTSSGMVGDKKRPAMKKTVVVSKTPSSKSPSINKSTASAFVKSAARGAITGGVANMVATAKPRKVSKKKY